MFVRIKFKMNDNVLCMVVELHKSLLSTEMFKLNANEKTSFLWINCYFPKNTEVQIRPLAGLKKPHFKFDPLFA